MFSITFQSLISLPRKFIEDVVALELLVANALDERLRPWSLGCAFGQLRVHLSMGIAVDIPIHRSPVRLSLIGVVESGRKDKGQ